MENNENKSISSVLEKFGRTVEVKKKPSSPAPDSNSKNQDEKAGFNLFTTKDIIFDETKDFLGMQQIMYITESQLASSINSVIGAIFEDYLGCSLRPQENWNPGTTSPFIQCTLDFNYNITKIDTDKLYALTKSKNDKSKKDSKLPESLRLIMEYSGKKNVNEAIRTELTQEAEEILGCLKYDHLSWKDTCYDSEQQYNRPDRVGTTLTALMKQVTIDPEKIIRFIFQGSKYDGTKNSTGELVESTSYKKFKNKKFYIRYFKSIGNTHIYMIYIEDRKMLDEFLTDAMTKAHGIIDPRGFFLANPSKGLCTLSTDIPKVPFTSYSYNG